MEENNVGNCLEISSKSRKEEVAQFFVTELKFSENIKENIINQDISGDILLDLKDKDFKVLGLNKNQIQNVRDYLSDNYENFININIDIEINENSTIEDVDKFFKKYIGFNEKIKNIDGKQFLSLTKDNISKLGLNIGQTKRLEKYLKKCKNKNKEKRISSNNDNSINKNSTIIEDKEISKSEDINNKKDFIKKDEINLNSGKEEDKNSVEKNIENNSFIWNLVPNLNISLIWPKSINQALESNKNNQLIINENVKSNIIINNNDNIIDPKGTVLGYNQYQKITDTKIRTLYKESDYNLFFILVISQDFYNSSLSFFSDNSCIVLWKTILNYNHIFLVNEEIANSDGNKKRFILIQIPSNNIIHRFSVSLVKNEENKNKEIRTQIEIREEVKNYFCFKNLNFGGYFPEEKIDFILKIYFDYFIQKDINNFELTKDLIQASINTISLYNNSIYFTNNNLFKLFRVCLDYNFKIEKMNLIEFNEDEANNNIIDKDFMLTGKEIDKLFLLFDDAVDLDKIKDKLSLFFVISYAKNNKKYIKSLLQSKNKNIYKRNLFDLLLKGDLQISDLNFKDRKNIKKFQQDILFIAQSLNEINYIIKLFDNIIEVLEFVNKNCSLIYKILDEEKEKNNQKQINTYLFLPDIDKEDNFELIIEYLSYIVEKCKSRNYLLLNYGNLFAQFCNLYSDKSLEELCVLKKLIAIFDEKNIYPDTIENYYNQIHQKGMNLIRGRKLSIPEIITFIKKQDAYYIDDKYKNHDNRDPSIFRYINIIDINEKNIELIKKNHIMDIFNNSYSKSIQFYEAILSQINKIKDFESLFKLFSESSINIIFNQYINNKYNTLVENHFNEEIKN